MMKIGTSRSFFFFNSKYSISVLGDTERWFSLIISFLLNLVGCESHFDDFRDSDLLALNAVYYCHTPNRLDNQSQRHPVIGCYNYPGGGVIDFTY